MVFNVDASVTKLNGVIRVFWCEINKKRKKKYI